MLVFFSWASISQTGGVNNPRSECINFNAFLDNPTAISQLQLYVDEIDEFGIIQFDIEQIEEMEDISVLYPILEVDEGSTFSLERTFPSLYNDENENERYYLKYQQYHDGIKVFGGGYTEERIIIDGPGPPSGPCGQALYALTTYINSDINISTTPLIKESQLPGILSPIEIYSTELMIVPHLLEDCNYNLVWKTHYRNNEDSQIAFVDAHTGNILKTESDIENLFAPIVCSDYLPPGQTTVELDDGPVGGPSTLITEDGTVFTYDIPSSSVRPPFDASDIPVATAASESANLWGTESTAHVYQTHYVGKEVFDEVNAFLDESLGITMNTLRIQALPGLLEKVATFRDLSTFSDAVYIRMTGGTNGSSFSVRDAIGHELAHAVVYEIIGKERVEEYNSLVEGFCDIFGTYIEYRLQNNVVDWVLVDDETGSAQNLRTFSTPVCLDDVENDEKHTRGLVFGHWFYLMTTGNATITGVGIETSMKIVMEAMQKIHVNSDYSNLRQVVLNVVDNEYGPCSPEGVAARRAWAAVCVGDPSFSSYSCTGNFSFEPKYTLCAQLDYLRLCINGTSPGVDYKWKITVLGNNSLNWDMTGSQTGNSVYLPDYNNCFEVNDFPNYPYYPRLFKIKAYSSVAGVTIYQNFKLLGCNGEPTCEEYYGIEPLITGEANPTTDNDLKLSNSSQGIEESPKSDLESTRITEIKVFNVMGQLLYQGDPQGFNKFTYPYTGMVVIVYFDREGKFYRSEKQVLMNEN